MNEKKNLFDELGLLGTLGQIAHESLAPLLAPEPHVAPTAVAEQSLLETPSVTASMNTAAALRSLAQKYAQRPATASELPPMFISEKKEYQAALKDPSIVDAILELQKKRRIATPRKEEVVLVTNPTLELDSSYFAPLQIPSVEAAPKPSGNFRKTPGIIHPILRGK